MRRRGYQGPASRAVATAAAQRLALRVTGRDREDDLSDFYEERAAICEYVGNLPRATAERFARERTERRRRLLLQNVRRAP